MGGGGVLIPTGKNREEWQQGTRRVRSTLACGIFTRTQRRVWVPNMEDFQDLRTEKTGKDFLLLEICFVPEAG